MAPSPPRPSWGKVAPWCCHAAMWEISLHAAGEFTRRPGGWGPGIIHETPTGAYQVLKRYLFRIQATLADGSSAPAFARPWLRYGYGASEAEARRSVMKEFNDVFNPAGSKPSYLFTGSPVLDIRRAA
uniref:Uncharacterized protein n=1 Tax=viral metagenome TaxID=1070528 RepID=A0A6M3XRT7_9ZZZZ